MPTSALQRLLPVMPASQNSGVGQIAVIPSSIAAHFQRLVSGEKLTSGRGAVKLALDARSHGISSGAIEPQPPVAATPISPMRMDDLIYK